MTTTKEYSNVRKKLLQTYESICDDAGYTLCTTTTETTPLESNGQFVYQEVDKPICTTSVDCSTVIPVVENLPEADTLEMAFQDMEDGFEDNCVMILMGDKPKSCQVSVSVPSSFKDENENDDDKNEDIGNYQLEKDYSQSPILPTLTDMCHLNNLAVCHLTTIATLDDGNIMLYETNKPMCLVKDCENVEVEEWEFMDPFPLCQNKNCEVVSQTLVCDSSDSENNDTTTLSEEEEEDDNQCVETVENFFGNENLTSLYEELQDEMLSECDSTLRGEESSRCHIITPTIQTINLTTLEEGHVMDVVESCVMAGISTCYVTGVATETLREVSQWEVTQVIYDHYPLCLPLACQENENDLDVLLRTHLPSFSSSLDRTMQMDEVMCDISLSPSQSSIPSSSPSRTSSLFPSLHISATPSLSSSDSPTVPPSTTRSSVPSVPPSSIPATEMPSSSPIESVSNAPSPMETVDPTAAPTDPRTLVLPETDLPTSTPPMETDNDNDIDLVAPTSSATSSRWNLTWMVGGMMTVILSLYLV